MNKDKKNKKKIDKYDVAEALHKVGKFGKKYGGYVISAAVPLVSKVIFDKFKKD